ncbi:MAG: T9SS type A sorting domain-containing protein [Bacteroidetes bacterium]|nr:T9SS type A sorting domain-containing protein [Bacteroidota bacterium]
MKKSKQVLTAFRMTQFRKAAISILFSGLFLLSFVAHGQVMILNFAPNSGCGGVTPVIITGINFTGATSVTFGGLNAQSFVVNSPTQITAIPGLGNTGMIEVTTPIGSGTAGPFTVNIPPPIPNPVTATPATICQGSTSQLNATSSPGDIEYWYTVPTGGATIGSSLSGANFAVNPVITTTYYVENGGAVGPGGTQTFSYTGAVQNFVVPAGVTTLTIDAKGAQGGTFGAATGGLGARMIGDFSVTPGQTLSVWVGGEGIPSQNAGGGGGGSGVVDGLTPLIIAGGGGGGSGQNIMEPGQPGGTGTSGGNSSGAGGTAGNGGEKGYISGDCGWAGGGGGFLTDGYGGDGNWDGGPLPGVPGGPAAGKSSANGGAGGLLGGCGFQPLGAGGWGCGGGGRGEYGGGGGGGYSGGGGGQYVASPGQLSGGGGGSYNSGVNQNNTAGFQTGNGEVIITWTGAPICPSPRVPVTVTVNPAVITASANPSVICPGGSSVLSASGGVSYIWNPGGLIGNPSVSPAVTTTYTVTGTTGAGCTATSTVTVTVTGVPVVVAVATPALICLGDSSVLSASGGATYLWNPGGLVGSPTVAPAVTTTYTVTGTVGGGCTGTSVVTVTVNPIPVAPNPVTATPSTICQGATSQLNATAGANDIMYWYTVPTGGIAIGSSLSGANFPVTPAVTTTYYVENGGQVGPGGSQTFNYTGSVQNFTVPAGVTSIHIVAKGAEGGGSEDCANTVTNDGGLGGEASGDLAVLPGQSINIYVGGKPTTNLGANSPGGFNGGGGAGQYGGPGGGASDVRVGGLALVNRVIVAGGGGGGNTGCPDHGAGGAGGGLIGGNGQGFQNYVPGGGGSQIAGGAAGAALGAAGALGIGAGTGTNYHEGGGGGGYYGGGSAYAAGGGGGSSYIGGVTGGSTTSGVQSGNGQVIITWGGAAPCFSVRVPVTVTVNAAPTVTATASADSICVGGSSVLTGGGAVSYVWNPGGLVGSPTVTPAVTTTYTVTGTNAAGCTATATVMVTVNNTPVVTATASPSIICAGASSVLTGGGAATYTWNPGGLVGSPTVTPAATTIYTVTGSVGAGCSATSIVIVTVNPAPPVTASASPASICTGGSTVLTGGGAATYLWNPGGLVGSPTVSPVVTTTYTVTGSVAGGCSATSVVTVTVNPGINVTATATPSTICVGSSSVLTGGGGAIYTWMPGGLGGSPTVTPVVTTTYTVTGSNGAGCTGTSVVTVTVVSLNPIIVNTGGVLSVLNGPYTTYQWYRNGTPIAGATNPTHTVVQNGTYEVEVTLNGCTKRSPSLILNGVGVNDITLNGYSISPNPTKDKLQIHGVIPAEIKILSMDGKVIMEVRNTSEISLSSLSDGIYFIQLFDAKGHLLYKQKIAKQ